MKECWTVGYDIKLDNCIICIKGEIEPNMQTTIKLDIIVVVRKGFIIKAQKCDEYCGCNSHQERQTNVKWGTYRV